MSQEPHDCGHDHSHQTPQQFVEDAVRLFKDMHGKFEKEPGMQAEADQLRAKQVDVLAQGVNVLLAIEAYMEKGDIEKAALCSVKVTAMFKMMPHEELVMALLQACMIIGQLSMRDDGYDNALAYLTAITSGELRSGPGSVQALIEAFNLPAAGEEDQS